ncbi:hypothetical protein [Streptomyces flaveolus]|uniref:hypothetical protein n=1 Tax=Streptomyces flaveolus TaxID=67297 RepID=UPI00344028DD
MRAPLAVNTADGTCWTRRGALRNGEALYAPEGVCSCPEFVMATLAELAEHGITGSLDALPMPTGASTVVAGPSEAELDVALGEVTAYLRLRLALASAQRGRHELRDRVAELERWLTERERPADEDPIAYALTDQAAPAVGGCPRNVIDGDVGNHLFKYGAFVDGPMRCMHCGAAKPEEDVAPQVQKLRALLAGQREQAAAKAPHDGPQHHTYRLGRDLPETGGAR